MRTRGLPRGLARAAVVTAGFAPIAASAQTPARNAWCAAARGWTASTCRAAYRYAEEEGLRNYQVGLRVARDMP
jgi:hypothetical protein